jgi:hypothetical protein
MYLPDVFNWLKQDLAKVELDACDILKVSNPPRKLRFLRELVTKNHPQRVIFFNKLPQLDELRTLNWNQIGKELREMIECTTINRSFKNFLSLLS